MSREELSTSVVGYSLTAAFISAAGLVAFASPLIG